MVTATGNSAISDMVMSDVEIPALFYVSANISNFDGLKIDSVGNTRFGVGTQNIAVNQAVDETALLAVTQASADSSLFSFSSNDAEINHDFGLKVGLNNLNPLNELDIVGNFSSVSLNLTGKLTLDELDVSGNENFINSKAFLGLGNKSRSPVTYGKSI